MFTNFIISRKIVNTYKGACLWFWVLVSLSYLSSCSGTNKLPEGKRLYTGAQVKIESSEKISDEATLASALEAVITPQPNKSFFGIRPGLFFYNLAGTPKKKKGLRSFIKNNLGEEPVFYDSVNNTRITELMVNRLNNNGYFKPTVSYKANIEEKTASVTYTAHVTRPYTIATIDYPASDTAAQVYLDIATTQAASLLKVGDPYNLTNFTNERVRIDAALKNKGYFYFSPDYIIFKVDTTQNDYTLNVHLRIKPDAPEKGIQPYKVNDISIYTDFTLDQDSIPDRPPVMVQGYRYFPDEEALKAKRLLRSVFLHKGELYTRNDHALTLSRLMGLGVFQFVDMQFRENLQDSLPYTLNANLRLTPMRLQSIRAELETVQQNNGFAGPGFNINYRHRNLMRGAEQLIVTLNVAQQSYVGSRNRSGTDNPETDSGNGLNSFEIGARAELNVPRFITPFRQRNLRTQFVPRTRFTLGANYMDRVQYFRMIGYNATYGYVYRPKRRITHELTPINIQYNQLVDTTAAFTKLLNENQYLQRTFQSQFILGSIYNFTYNTQADPKQRTHFFFNGNIDASGNVLNLLQTQALGSDNPNTIAKQAYAQYVRLDLDTRYYWAVTRRSQLATRMLVGVGLPYGNSRNLPYVKQFSIGGPNSIRAFRPRELGPGTYSSEDESGFFDQTGDLRFETNVEYRFDIVPYLKGAVFVDAGNIWLSRPDPERLNGEFVASKALSQLAVGTGAGLRIDAEFFVLRFDLGVPVRDPVEPSPYVFRIPPERKNLVFHIAVGYPF